MPKQSPVARSRVVVTRGFDRLRFGVRLVVAALGIGLFVSWSLSISHGLYALIVLLGCAVALTLVGGPERLARTITMTGDEIRIERFHRITTTVQRAELAEARADVLTDSRGRPRASLILVPRHPVDFYARHRELRSVRRGDAACVPAGTSPQTACELTEALDESRLSPGRGEP